MKRSITHMRRMLNLPLLAGVVFLASLSLCLIEPAAAELEKLPRVDKHDHKGYTEKIPDTDVSLDVLPIPGGAYHMGSPSGENGRKEDEGPQHPVSIRPFWMGKYEVTWDEWDLYR